MSAIDKTSLAADLALGLAEGAERERAERLEETDAAFASDVARYRATLSELDMTAPEIAPSSQLFQRIERSIAAAPLRPAPIQRSGLMAFVQSLLVWRLAAGFASAAACFLAVALYLAPAAPVLVAVLETGDGRPAAVVNIAADGTATLIPLQVFDVPSERVIQVWTLQSREQGPVSVGLMSQARTLRLDLNRLGMPQAGHLFEMTLEPAGGSPTGRPTGPILVKGLAARSL